MSPALCPERPILVVDDEEQAILDLTEKLKSDGLLNVLGCRAFMQLR